MEVGSFAEIEHEFLRRAHTMEYCCCATIDTRQRPRTRVLHPIWEGSIGWIASGRASLKSKHLVRTPFLSLAYMPDPMRPLYVDCRAQWEEDEATKLRIWNLFKTTPPPLGYDPSRFGETRAIPYGVLRLTPWRIGVADLLQPQDTRVWRDDK